MQQFMLGVVIKTAPPRITFHQAPLSGSLMILVGGNYSVLHWLAVAGCSGRRVFIHTTQRQKETVRVQL